MSNKLLRTQQYWCAAYFLNRSKERDTSSAIKVLKVVANTSTGAVQRQASQLLEKSKQ